MFDTIILPLKQAGEIVENAYKEIATYHYKDEHNIVTDTDIATEKLLVDAILKNYPDHSIFSEEMGERLQQSDYLWVIDPLDGTTNFSHRIPQFCISIGLVHKGETLFAAVYQPMSKELYLAEKNKGAHLNDKKLTGSICESLTQAVAGVEKGGGTNERARCSKIIDALIEKERVHSIRYMGATALDLCYVAAGRFDIFVNNACKLHDWIAGGLIAEEAGMKIGDFQGEKLKLAQTDIIVANSTIHPLIVNALKNI